MDPVNNNPQNNQNPQTFNNPLDEPLPSGINSQGSSAPLPPIRPSVPSAFSSPPPRLDPLKPPPIEPPPIRRLVSDLPPLDNPLDNPSSPGATSFSPIKPPTQPPPPSSPFTPTNGDQALSATFNLPTEEEIAAAQKRDNPPPPSSSTTPPTSPPLPSRPPIKNIPPPPQAVKKSGSSIGKIIFIFLIVIILAFGGVVVASYFGLLEIPLISKYLSFNKKNFKKAVAAATTALAKDQNYNFIATIKIESPQKIDATSPEFPDLTDSGTSQKLFTDNLNFLITGGHNQNKEISGNLAITPTNEQSNIFNLSFDLASDQKTVYLRPSNLSFDQKTTWNAITREDLRSVSLDSFLDLTDLAMALTKLKDGTWQSEEKIEIKNQQDEVVGEIDTFKYQVTNQSFDNEKIKNFALSANFAKDDAYMVKVAAQGNLTSGETLNIEYNYFNFGKSQPVVIPSPDVVKTVILADFLKENGFYFSDNLDDNDIIPDDNQDDNQNDDQDENQQPSGRDKTRTDDLNKIAQAIEKYQEENGAYPISSDIEKTNNSTVLKESLVPNYLDKLPVDPQDPTYWYGYSSDGYSFRLTSIIEDPANANALRGQSVKYQEVVK